MRAHVASIVQDDSIHRPGAGRAPKLQLAAQANAARLSGLSGLSGLSAVAPTASVMVGAAVTAALKGASRTRAVKL